VLSHLPKSASGVIFQKRANGVSSSKKVQMESHLPKSANGVIFQKSANALESGTSQRIIF
jgi:hypothetical protein